MIVRCMEQQYRKIKGPKSILPLVIPILSGEIFTKTIETIHTHINGRRWKQVNTMI